MPILILALFLLNVFDLVSTLYLVRTGFAYEANPFMAYFLDIGEWALVLVKLALVIPSCVFLYTQRDLYMTKVSTIAAVVLYSLLAVYHIYGLILSSGG